MNPKNHRDLCRKLVPVMVAISGISTQAFSRQGTQNVQYLGNLNQYPAIGYNDCWGYTAPSGKEYALLGVRNGTSIIDITDAPTLTEVDFVQTDNTTWKDIKTYRHYAYVVTDGIGRGIQIIDLSTLPDSVYLVGTFGGSTFTSHNISIDTSSGILYAQGGGGIVRVFNLADPENPVELSVSFEGLRACHDVFAENGRLYVSEGFQGTVGIYDVTIPAQPALLARLAIPSSGYVHNAWPSRDGSSLMTTEETPGKTVKLWNISNLSAISMTDEYLAPERLAHNTHIKGSYAYISHYKDGLRIVNISDPSNIFEEGYYDTYHLNLSGDYHGAWGAYPFFRSGKILISNIETGLYVVSFSGAVVSVERDVSAGLPQKLFLGQNHPNPFNPSTEIPIELPEAGWAVLRVYNLLGKEVAVLLNGSLSAGRHSILFNAAHLPSGFYFYRLETPKGAVSRKMCLMR
jgi:choice-of-anchor B domain-containing protein